MASNKHQKTFDHWAFDGKSAGQNPFSQWQDYLSQFSTFNNGATMNKFFDIYKRNLETLSALNQMTIDCGQSITRCQGEAVSAWFDDCVRSLETLQDNSPAEQKIKKSTSAMQDAAKRSAAAAQEMTQILARSNQEIFETLRGRMQETLADLQDIAPTEIRKAGKR